MSDNIFICKECQKMFNGPCALATHIKNIHKLTAKDYYDTYIKNITDGICHECGNPTKFMTISTGYKKFCSNKCARSSNETKEKYKQTCLKKYGVDSTNKLDSTKIKSKETCLKKYGYEYASQSEEFKTQSKQTCLEKYGVEYSFQSDNNKEKSKKTCLEKYGVESYSKTIEFKEKFKETCNEKYGVNAPAQCKDIFDKVKKTNLEKYGVEYVLQNSDIKEKIKNTMIEKYGDENYCKILTHKDHIDAGKLAWDNDAVEKRKNTCLKKYNKEFIGQVHELHVIASKKYLYNNIMFDSSWELAYYIWLIDHNIEFEYQPEGIKYQFNNKDHYYYPDFKVNNELVEIKGDHFFDKTGNFRCPFNITDQYLQEQYKAKYQCMLDNNVKIMKYNEVRTIMYYIDKTYGKKYLKQFKQK